MKGGLEAGIHLSRLMIEANQHNPEMCLLKVDFFNAFNQVDRIYSFRVWSIISPNYLVGLNTAIVFLLNLGSGRNGFFHLAVFNKVTHLVPSSSL